MIELAKPESENLIFDRRTREEREYWTQLLSREFGPSGLTPDYPRLGSSVN